MAEAVKPGYADTKTVKALAKDMPDEFLHCRDLGHNWKPHGATVVPAAQRKQHNGAYYERTMQCATCRAQRHQYLSRLGSVMSNNYSYPEGYQTPEGTGRIAGSARDVLRVTGILREINRAGNI